LDGRETPGLIPVEKLVEGFIVTQFRIEKLVQLQVIGAHKRLNGFNGFWAVVDSPFLQIR
jgi:hypothetical protein